MVSPQHVWLICISTSDIGDNQLRLTEKIERSMRPEDYITGKVYLHFSDRIEGRYVATRMLAMGRNS